MTKCAGTATPRTALGCRIDVVSSSILDGTFPPQPEPGGPFSDERGLNSLLAQPG